MYECKFRAVIYYQKSINQKVVSKHFYVKKVDVLITKCVCVKLEQLFSARKVLIKKC